MSGLVQILDLYDDKLNFDYIKKYFGDNILKSYVNRKAKELTIISPEYVKYIDDPKTKLIYNIYNKLISNWEFGSGFNASEEQLETLQDMPDQDVTPKPIFYKEWGQFDDNEKKVIIGLAQKYKGADYAGLLYALPYIIKI